MRLRKVRETHTNARTLIAETRYLPNLELRSNSGTGEVLQVISVQAGRSSVRVLHWESGPPRDSANDQYRYHLNDHLGSCTLELDKDGEVISQERYHPYGSTAWFAGRAEVEAKYRTVRYSGKERDATGLYYYGFRYYLAGWQRWLNPDPGGVIDGLNLYRAMRNSPITFVDPDGLIGEKPVPSPADNAALDAFFTGAEFKVHLLVKKEIDEAMKPKIFGMGVANPFKKADRIIDSQEKLRAANYEIKNGLLYRAHFSSVEEIKRQGVVRNNGGGAGNETIKDYIADLFRHTAGTGSQGAVLSMSASRDRSKKFMEREKTLVTIDLNKFEPEAIADFMTVPELILEYGGMMLREKRIEFSDLVKAIDQLNNNEQEVFFVGKFEDLQYGEIPSTAITAVKSMGQKGYKLAATSS